MFDVVGVLEPMVQGRWYYVAGFIFGFLTLVLIRVLYLVWVERQTSNDLNFVRTHENVPMNILKRKVWFLLFSIIILSIVILPGSMWLTVEVLKSIENINPGIALLFVLALFSINLTILIIQTVRYRRLNRRIKLMM